GTEFIRRFRATYEEEFNEDLKLGGCEGPEAMRSRHQALERFDWFFGSLDRAAIVHIFQFSSQPLLAWPASFLDALLEMDEAFGSWRDRHIKMVARVLGGGRI